MPKRVVAAIITTDNREDRRLYGEPAPFFGTAPAALLQGFAGMADCEVHVIACVQKPVKSPAKLAENIFYHSVEVGKWGWMRSGYAGCIMRVRKKLREIRPDIVHGQGTERYCALAAVFSGYPNVVTIHGNMLGVARALGARAGSFYWLATRLETLALARTRGVFCNSAYTEELVRPRARRTWRVPNALQEIYFKPLPARTPAPRPVLINVGHIASYKRQVEILAVAGRLHAAGAMFEMQFVGGCSTATVDYGREFLAKIKAAGEAGYARFLGEMGTAEVVERLDAADGMIHFPREEAFGLAAAEGLARNLKFFGPRGSGVADIAANVEGAELIGMEDWEGLTQAVLRWLKSGALRPASAALEMKGRYHPQVVARRHLEIYREVIDG